MAIHPPNDPDEALTDQIEMIKHLRDIESYRFTTYSDLLALKFLLPMNNSTRTQTALHSIGTAEIERKFEKKVLEITKLNADNSAKRYRTYTYKYGSIKFDNGS
jgi:hypothetical protein